MWEDKWQLRILKVWKTVAVPYTKTHLSYSAGDTEKHKIEHSEGDQKRYSQTSHTDKRENAVNIGILVSILGLLNWITCISN